MRDWTDEAKQRQREQIMAAKPWLKSTGPKTKRGKQRASQNNRKSASLEQWWHCNDPHEKSLIWRRLWRAPQGKASK
jgi:hypothetical protein